MINRGLFQKHHILKGSGSPAATAAAAQAAAEKGLPTQNSAGGSQFDFLSYDRISEVCGNESYAGEEL